MRYEMPRDVLTIFLYSFEIFLCISAVFTNLIFFVISNKTTLLHANLRILLYSQSIALVMMAIARAITDLNALIYIIALSIDPTSGVYERFIICKAFTAIYDCSFYSSILMFVVLAFERIFATLHARTYENEGRKLPIILITISWLVCIALIVGSVSVELSNPDLWWVIEGRGRILTCAQTFLGPIVLLYYLLAIITINIISLTVFLLVFRYNYKKYGSSLTAMTSQHSLSERYQTIEIVKATKFLFPSVATILIENAIAITIVVIISLNIEEESANISEISHLWILEQLYTITAILFAFFEPLVRIIFHSALRHKLYEMIVSKLQHLPVIKQASRKVASAHEPAIKTADTEVKDAFGRQMLFSQEEEKQMHFARLKDAWSSPRSGAATRKAK